MDRPGASSYSVAVESAGHALSGLAAFSLLPLFHFQLFFLLESMGGNGFVLCLAWVVVPSVATRVPRLQVLAARHLREMQAIAGGLLAGSLAAGAAGFLTVRLALSAAGLSVAWGFCQAPHWGRGRGAEVMDGLVAGNHLALVLRLGAGLLYPPSPVVRFLQSLLLPTLLLLGLWFVPPSPLHCWRSSRGGSCSGRGRRFSAGSASWRYLRLFEEGGLAGQQQQQQQQQQQLQTQEQHQEVERQQLQTRQRQQTRQQVERQRPGPLGGNCSTAFATAAASAALSGGGGGGGGGESDDGGGLELAVARFRRRGGEDHERGVGRQPRQRRPQRREVPLATSALPSPAKAPPTETIVPGASGIGAATEAAAARVAAAASAASAAAGAEAAAAKAAEAVAAAAAEVADGLFPPSSRPSSPPLPIPRRRWQGGDVSQPSPGFLESLVASAGFGGLLFLTVLLTGSPWTGDDWAPSPGLGVFWSALRQASVVVAWGLGRAFASTTASASSPAGTAASGTRAGVACPSAPETAVLLEGGREGEEMMQAAAVPAAPAAPAAASPATAAPATATSAAAAAAAAAAAGSAGEGSRGETKGERNGPAAAAATSVAEAAAVDDNDFDEEGGLLEAAGTEDDSPVHSPAEITVAAAGSRRRAGLAAALHTFGAEEEEFGRSEASAKAAAVAAATAAGDVRRGVDDDDDAASCLAAAAVLVAGVSVIALCPERPLAVVPGISAVALVLPSLWAHLEASCPPGGVGNDGAAVRF
ncbi:unnamed protein product, partial [Ectocarpus sp. 6 AP-2014]